MRAVQFHVHDVEEADIEVRAQALACRAHDLVGAADYGQRLRQLVQKGGLVLAPLTLGNFIKDDTNESATATTDSREVRLIPPSGVHVVVFKARRLARSHHAVKLFHPVAFHLWHHFTDESTHNVLQAGLLFISAVDFPVSEIDHRAGRVLNHFDNGKTLVNRIKQRAVFFFRASPSFFSACTLDSRPRAVSGFLKQPDFLR